MRSHSKSYILKTLHKLMAEMLLLQKLESFSQQKLNDYMEARYDFICSRTLLQGVGAQRCARTAQFFSSSREQDQKKRKKHNHSRNCFIVYKPVQF